jgi:RES domain-containing protein
MALEQGAKGILFPSLAHTSGTNLVVYTETLTESDSLEVYDPKGDLPHNASSWQ